MFTVSLWNYVEEENYSGADAIPEASSLVKAYKTTPLLQHRAFCHSSIIYIRLYDKRFYKERKKEKKKESFVEKYKQRQCKCRICNLLRCLLFLFQVRKWYAWFLYKFLFTIIYWWDVFHKHPNTDQTCEDDVCLHG